MTLQEQFDQAATLDDWQAVATKLMNARKPRKRKPRDWPCPVVRGTFATGDIVELSIHEPEKTFWSAAERSINAAWRARKARHYEGHAPLLTSLVISDWAPSWQNMEAGS